MLGWADLLQASDGVSSVSNGIVDSPTIIKDNAGVLRWLCLIHSGEGACLVRNHVEDFIICA